MYKTQLQGRTFAYTDTQRYRIGANFAQLPVNRPVSPVANDQQDGYMAYKNPPGCVNYKPNSLDRNNPQEDVYKRQHVYKAGNPPRSKCGRATLIVNIIGSICYADDCIHVIC